MTDLGDERGILYPARLPTFHREPVPADLRELIRWFWIPRWNLAPGRTSRQEILPFPAANLVVQEERVALAGPTTGISHRDLHGRGWAVGALLRPAGLASLHDDPAALCDSEIAVEAAPLHRAVSAAMHGYEETAGRNRAVQAYASWAREHLSPPDATGALANAMEDLIATDPTIVRIEQVARHLGLSVRSVQRLAHRSIGRPPLAIIRRYRLQEATQRLRDDPAITIAEVAAELGYADHAHLSHDFRHVLGFSPSVYRHDTRPADQD